MKWCFLIILNFFIVPWSLADSADSVINVCHQLLASHGSFSTDDRNLVSQKPKISTEAGRYILEQLKVLRPTVFDDEVSMTWRLPGENYVGTDGAGRPVAKLRKKPWNKWIFLPPYGTPSISAVHGFDFGMPESSFYETLYERYGSNFDQELLRVAKASEEKLDSYRSDHGEVVRYNSDGPQIIGQVRVYSGSHSDHHEGWLGDPLGRLLPFEVFLQERGLGDQYSLYQFFRDAIEAGDPEFRFFEIGKLTANGTAEERDAILGAFEEFILGYYLNIFPKAIFIAHVVTPIHLRLFTKRYGMTRLYSIDVGEGKQEHILFMTGQHFKERILELRGKD